MQRKKRYSIVMYHKRITTCLGIVADSSDGKSAKALGEK